MRQQEDKKSKYANIMKAIYKKIIFILPILAMLMSGCSNEEPYATASSDDFPQILDPLFPDHKKGELPVVANIARDANFKMDIVVTPSASTEVKWYIDDKEVAQGCKIDMALPAGSYTMKVVATNGSQSTYREGIVKVNPLASDPWSEKVGFERILAPGAPATIPGVNLGVVRSVKIGDIEVTNVTYHPEIESIQFEVPKNVSNGVHRLYFVDSDGNEYGANTVTISADALVISGAERMTVDTEVTLKGINLNTVTAMKLGDKTMEIVSKSNTEMVVKCPTMADGDYTLQGTASTGSVQFISGNQIVSQFKVAVSSQKTLWSGHHYVSWDQPDSSPNKTFNKLSADIFKAMKPGTTLTIHYSIEPSAEYHKMGVATGWWSDLIPQFEFQEDGVKTVEMTQEMLDKIAAEAGFLIVGHGFYIDMVTMK